MAVLILFAINTFTAITGVIVDWLAAFSMLVSVPFILNNRFILSSVDNSLRLMKCILIVYAGCLIASSGVSDRAVMTSLALQPCFN